MHVRVTWIDVDGCALIMIEFIMILYVCFCVNLVAFDEFH